MASIKLPSYDDLFATEADKSLTDNRSKKINLADLHEFKNHPFKVRDDEDMDRLKESVLQSHGVIEPILVRQSQTQKGKYEIVSGHRRVHACKLAGFTEIEAIVKEMSDAQATVCMVDANLKREKILPSELAQAFKMKLEAEKQLSGNSGQSISDESGMSRANVYRYIKLAELMPELLEKVDNKKIAIGAGAILVELDEEEQHIVNSYLEKNSKIKINPAKAKEIVELDIISEEKLEEILNPPKEMKKEKILFPKSITNLFPKGTSMEEIEEKIIQAISKSSVSNETPQKGQGLIQFNKSF